MWHGRRFRQTQMGTIPRMLSRRFWWPSPTTRTWACRPGGWTPTGSGGRSTTRPAAAGRWRPPSALACTTSRARSTTAAFGLTRPPPPPPLSRPVSEEETTRGKKKKKRQYKAASPSHATQMVPMYIPSFFSATFFFLLQLLFCH